MYAVLILPWHHLSTLRPNIPYVSRTPLSMQPRHGVSDPESSVFISEGGRVLHEALQLNRGQIIHLCFSRIYKVHENLHQLCDFDRERRIAPCVLRRQGERQARLLNLSIINCRCPVFNLEWFSKQPVILCL